MMRSLMIIAAVAVCMSLSLDCGAQVQGPSSPAPKESALVNGLDVLIGGCGGVYFLAEPGELVVEVEKRDRNIRGGPTELRAILVGPDRSVLQEERIPDDGQARGSGLGPVQRARLSTRVQHKGVYALNITVSQDRYGEEMFWSFRTNCPKHVIETARGHKDERHQEPIVLASPDRPGDVCFAPRTGELAMEIAGLPEGVRELSLYDAKGALIRRLAASEGKAAQTFPASADRGAAPWRLHLPSAQATLNIDGLTRWAPGDLCPDVSCWTPDAKAWLPLLEYRWLLTPYRRVVYGRPGESGRMAFQVHNNSDAERTIRLGLEFPEGEWPARLSTERVTLAAKKAAQVSVEYAVPQASQTRVCHVRATPAEAPEFSTYSSLTVRAGEAPAARPLTMPLVLKPYQHENEQFGYVPDCPVEWELYFDLQNRPCARVGNGISALRDGRWQLSDFATTVRSSVPEFEGASYGTHKGDSKIAFDRDNDMYTLGAVGGKGALLHSTDGGRTFTAYDLGRSGGFDIEQFSGHNVPDSPPPILRSVRTASDPNLRWRSLNDLDLILAEKRDGRLVIGEPIPLTRLSLGVGTHSGVPSAVVSRGSRVHVVWGEATDPQVKAPGVPTYVVTYDRQRRQLLGKPVLVGYGAPPNDGHNRPCITMDAEGYLHVLTGTHGATFHYARSLKPNDAHSGWTEAEPAGEGLRQTYIGMVCGEDGTLHTVFRYWRSGVEPHPLSTHATLGYQRKRPGQPWEEPKVLIVAPFSEYSIWYHRLTIDREGRLFLSYDYWSTYWFYRNDHFGDRRAMMMSPDGGETWKLVETRDVREAI